MPDTGLPSVHRAARHGPPVRHIVERFGDAGVLERAAEAIAAARANGVAVTRAGGVDALVLCGIATSGVVLSTLRQAADLDYGLTVLRDACADRDPEVDRVLTEKVFPAQAEVVDVADWAAAVGRAPVAAGPPAA
jgi:isochorismate hydrolase